ncbi:metallopeptidase family protein [Vulgatibacter incomptus]|uniref:Uncharacterized protein n=1 Tax=Vulgatibacter incomptus TaxID=1391653 RepID=A0A0K1PDT5_9BACT|nr:metallopeptidase family protein [Vulgatibacter incomptus]AKU91680.1 hypothetical protein AKJ08_2067 [Vulgatibacter incomptus]
MATRSDERLEALLRESARSLDAGNLDESLARAEEAVDLAPRSGAAHCAKAEALAALDRDEEAISSFDRAIALDKNDLDAIWGAAELFVTRMGEDPAVLERGLTLCRRGAKIARRRGEEEIAAELSFLEAIALSALGEPAAALTLLDEVRGILGDDPELLLERAFALFELCRFDDVQQELESLLREEPDLAWAHHYLGLVAERSDDLRLAEKHFAKARELSPEDFPEPVRLTETEFDEVVEEALKELPDQVRRYLSNVAIAVEPLPRLEEIQGPDPLSPSILGVFRGSPLKDKGTFDPWSHFPNSIVLYQRNLERFAVDREELIDEIGVTLLHEVGHFLGFDEDDLRERDLH